MTASVLQSTVVPTQFNAGGTGTTLATGSLSITAGSTLVLWATVDDAGTFTKVSDSVNGDWPSVLDQIDDSTDGQRVGVWVFQNTAAAGAMVVTLTSSSTNWRAIVFCEIGGVSTASLDGHTGQVQATPTTGTDATTSGNVPSYRQPALVLGFSFNGASAAIPAVGTGFSNVTSDGTVFVRAESKRVTTTGYQAATFTAGNNSGHVSHVVVFDEPHPFITAQPTDQTTCYPSPASATFTVSGTSSAGTLHYQWKKNGSNVGTDSNSYTASSLTTSDNASTIQCVLTDDNASVTTNTVYLYVKACPLVPWFTA